MFRLILHHYDGIQEECAGSWVFIQEILCGIVLSGRYMSYHRVFVTSADYRLLMSDDVDFFVLRRSRLLGE